ncbi:MAG: LysR family transcriptional regulator [Eggerthellaceae bacterium]|nr:LysR family transcriptional regulator [Eggerthellaceae bacterium]
MRFEALEYFTTAAECGSFTSAAKRLYVTQQGLSKAIAALERELGCRLFERDGARTALTAAGRALLPHARRCLSERDDLLAAAVPFARVASPGRVEAPHSPTLHAAAFVADSLFSLLEPDLIAAGLDDVTIIEHSCADIMRELGESATDRVFALCLPPDEAENLAARPELVFRPLFRTEMLLAGSSQFIRRGKGAFPLARVAELPVAYYNDAVLNRIIDEMFAEHPLSNVVTHASNLTRIMGSVSSGRAVTFTDALSAFLAAPSDDVAYAPIEGAASFLMGFAYRQDGPPDEAALAWMERFIACFRLRCAAYLAEPGHDPASAAA